jgi:protein tyrosine phosphatase (PTP) superfamily phosphohydrolase (DUF442 family)
VQLGAPEPLSAEGQRDGGRQKLPEGPDKPKVTQEHPSSPSLPADIAQFASATDQVASGLRPGVDGVKWLRENGYRAVLHLRPPGQDDAGDRNLFDLRGLKYLTLEVSPQTLTAKVVDDFNRIVADKANQPLFVYDKDGVLSGSLWYLHFRVVDKATDEEARAKAIRLGLKTDQDSEMWLAIQKYLSEQGK